MRWTGIHSFRVISFQDFNPVRFHVQAVLDESKPRWIHGEEHWNALPVSESILTRMIEVKGGQATQDSDVFDEESRLIMFGGLLFRGSV